MPHLNLDFLGTPVRLTAEPGPALEDLAQDFASFPPSGGEPAVAVRLCGRDCPAPAGPWRWGWRDFRVRARPGGRLVRWEDGSWADCDWRRGEVRIHACGAERLRELGWLAVLSRAGEALDRRGLHRVHALGVSGPRGAGLLLLPSGGGKSSIAVELMRRGGPLRLLSDESPLVGRDGVVHGFPLRVALRPGAAAADGRPTRPFRRRGYAEKRLLDAPPAAPSAPAAWVLLGEPSPGEPSFEPLSRARALAALAGPLVLGAGLAQMAEYMARLDPALAGIAASRAAAALALARRARAGRLRLGSRGPAAAADLLERVMGGP